MARGESGPGSDVDVLVEFDDDASLLDEVRNFAAHQYDDLDPRRAWRTVTCDVPALRCYVAEVLLPGIETSA